MSSRTTPIVAIFMMALGWASTPEQAQAQAANQAAVERSADQRIRATDLQPAITDDDLMLAILGELNNQPRIWVRAVNAEVKNGVVTLLGETNSLLAKQRLEEAVESIRGVRAIHNEIDLDAPERAPADIRAAVMTALTVNPAVESYEIQVSVSDAGLVVLRGAVDGPVERSITEDLTAGVLGVRGIVNETELRQGGIRLDSETAEAIRQRLRQDVLLADNEIDITVVEGILTLHGQVDNSLERRRTLELARVPGVKDVKAEELLVR